MSTLQTLKSPSDRYLAFIFLELSHFLKIKSEKADKKENTTMLSWIIKKHGCCVWWWSITVPRAARIHRQQPWCNDFISEFSSVFAVSPYLVSYFIVSFLYFSFLLSHFYPQISPSSTVSLSPFPLFHPEFYFPPMSHKTIPALHPHHLLLPTFPHSSHSI